MMKIEVAYGKDLNDNRLEQLLYLEADAYASYEMIDSREDEHIVCAIPTETLKHFRKRISNDLVFMYSREKKIAGIAFMSLNRKQKSAYLHTVYVKPAFRRHGVGSAIVKKAIAEAKMMKFAIGLGVNPLNENAIRLYEQFGFVPSKGQKIEMELKKNEYY